MDAFRDFDAGRRERERVKPEFDLGDEHFRCYAAPAAGPSLDLVGQLSAPSYRSWIRSVLRRDDAVQSGSGDEVEASSLERFDRLIYQHGDDAVDLETLIEVGDWLSEQYAGRPTEPSSVSSDGPPADGPPSKVTWVDLDATPTP